MHFIKKLIASIVIITAFLHIGCCQDFPGADSYFRYSGTDLPLGLTPVNVDIPNIMTGYIEDDDNGLNRLLRIFMPNTAMIDDGSGPSLLFYLKTIVNLLLSFVSLIALILLIYAFYMIFFKKDEAGITSAKQIIKGVIIALFVIGLSRIVVSFLFRFENTNTENVGYNNNTEITNSLT